jgi:hypothetical protein
VGKKAGAGRDGKRRRRVSPTDATSLRHHGQCQPKTAVDGRKTHQVAVATEQFEQRSITGLELLRSRGNCPESRANTRSALFGSNDNCGF